MSKIETTTNELLPNIAITNLVLGQPQNQNNNILQSLEDIKDLTLDVSFAVTSKITNLDNQIKDDEYYKYIKVVCRIKSQNEESLSQSINLLKENKQISLNNTFRFQNINYETFSVYIEEQFDFDKFAIDNNVRPEQLEFLKLTYNSQTESILYPILEDKKIVRIFDDENQTKSIVVDKRLVDGLERFDAKILQRPETTNNYLQIFPTHNNKNLTYFIIFDIFQFVRDTSYFIPESTNDYTVFLDISDEYGVLDTISITEDSFTSKQSVSILHTKQDKIVLSINKNIEKQGKNFTHSLNVKITNKDKSFINFYDRSTNTGEFFNLMFTYEIIKNIFALGNFYTNQKDPVFYLNTVTNKYTNQFENFYKNKTEYYKLNYDLNIDHFIKSTISKLYNKFSDVPITITEADSIVESLKFENTTYDVWQKLFFIFDKLFAKINNLLYYTAITPTKSIIKSTTYEIKKSNMFFSLSENYDYDIFPVTLYADIKRNFKSEVTTSIANYFIRNDVAHSIEETIKYGDETYNAIFAYSNTKLALNSNASFANIIEFTNLEQFGLAVEYSNANVVLTNEDNTIKSKSNFGVPTNIKVPNVNVKTTSISSLNNLNDNNRRIIEVKNSFIMSSLNGNTLSTPNSNTISPTLLFRKFDLNAFTWNIVTDVNQIQNNDLLEIAIYDPPQLFTLSKIPSEKIDLVNTYFIVNGKE
jgi:hypothetical protein